MKNGLCAGMIALISLFACNGVKGQGVGIENSDTLFQYFKNYHNGINGCFMNREKALEYLLKSANLGNPSAQKELGNFYFNGVHVPKNDSLAFYWHHKCASQDYAGAMDEIGFYYIRGIGCEMNPDSAYVWFLRGAQRNNAWAQMNLAVCYFDGIGCKKDNNEFAKWMRMSAENGCSEGMCGLAKMLYNGDALAKNMDESYYWAKKAYDSGCIEACNLLGNIELNHSLQDAFNWFKIGADAGDIWAIRNLAKMYETGEGCERDINLCVETYTKGANMGDPQSLYEFARVVFANISLLPKENRKNAKQQATKAVKESASKGFDKAIEYCRDHKIKL